MNDLGLFMLLPNSKLLQCLTGPYTICGLQDLPATSLSPHLTLYQPLCSPCWFLNEHTSAHSRPLVQLPPPPGAAFSQPTEWPIPLLILIAVYMPDAMPSLTCLSTSHGSLSLISPAAWWIPGTAHPLSRITFHFLVDCEFTYYLH